MTCTMRALGEWAARRTRIGRRGILSEEHQRRPWMPATGFAISIPAEVMQAVDRAARERGMTRSRFITEILRRVARAKRDEEISRRIDKALSDPRLTREQRSTASDYRRIQPRRGTEW